MNNGAISVDFGLLSEYNITLSPLRIHISTIPFPSTLGEVNLPEMLRGVIIPVDTRQGSPEKLFI